MTREQIKRVFALLLLLSFSINQVAHAFPAPSELSSETSTPVTQYKIPSGTTLAMFSLLIPAVAAQTASGGSDTGSSAAPVIDSTVACIIARELSEAAMFGASHLGAVIKNPGLTLDEKRSYLKRLVPAIACGVLTGGVISIAVGFSVAQAVGNLDTVANGVEAGEGASKTIGAFFVTKMTLKIPKWFGISNYHEPAREGDLENQAGANQQAVIGSRLAMAMSLFWNTLREATEGGTLTALAALLSKNSMDALGPSVGVGAASAIVLGGGMGLGAKYVSPKGFGIAATGLAELLAIGLVTGAVRSFEEVYAASHDGARTPVIYDFGGTQTGNTLTAFEFMGISDNLTALQLATWTTSAATITGLHIWHNYLGKPLMPAKVKEWVRGTKKLLTAPFKSCWSWMCGTQAPDGPAIDEGTPKIEIIMEENEPKLELQQETLAARSEVCKTWLSIQV